jgi:hypothetical protein
MVRRNEIAAPVHNAEAEPVTSLKNEWSVVEEDEEVYASNVNGLGDLAPSD